MKPKIKNVKGWYFCEGSRVVGCGKSIEVAYKDWKAKCEKVNIPLK